MGRPAVYSWPAASTTAIALSQSLAGAGSLALSGPMAVGVNGGSPIVVFQGFSRVITVTAGATDLSGVTFTITGTLNGATVSVALTGPTSAATTVTTQLFDTVTAITASAAAATVSAGIGDVGQTHWYLVDSNRSNEDFSVQVVVGGTIEYTFYSTLDDVMTNPSPFLSTTIGPMINEASSASYPHAILFVGDAVLSARMPIRYACISIVSGSGSLIATFLQQGI